MIDSGVLEHGRADTGDAELHYVAAGEGPLVVLLHGYPEFWYSWRRQLRTLADAGYRAVAPDMRGYNRSEKPEGIDPYRRSKLVDDVAGLIDDFGREDAVVVGHDWGGLVAWAFGMERGERVRKLGILNAPHPLAMVKGIDDPIQLLRSSYIFFFRLPVLPELAVGLGDCKLLRELFRRDPVREDAFTEEDIDRYVEAMSRPGAKTATINYYRAAAKYGFTKPLETIDQDVLVVWGDQDRYLGVDLADPPDDLVPNSKLVRLPDASHWVQADAPEKVDDLLVDFLNSGG